MKFRLKVSGLHLVISLCIAFFSLLLIFKIWHPHPLQKAVGVTDIVLLMLIIDVILGPILTLIVASSPTKKTLKFDLAIIVLLQFSAYIYGMYSIAVSRPVYIAFDSVRFEVVQANTVIRTQKQNILSQYLSNPWFFPQWVAVRPYKNVAEQQTRMQLEMNEAISPSMQAELYQPINKETWTIIKQKSNSLSNLNQTQQENIIQKFPKADGYMLLKAPEVELDTVVVLDIKHEIILGILIL